MKPIRQVDFPEKDQPLRDDVRRLGRLLGDVLSEQHGADLREQVETTRRAAILHREGNDEAARELEETLAALSTDRMRLLVRAFSTYLQLANLAERVHRVRRRRAYLRDGASAQRGSLEAVVGELAAAGIDRPTLCATLDGLDIVPVFTAHPTEATRRSILQKEYSIVQRLIERLNPALTPHEEEQAWARIRDAVTSGWQTRAVPHERPTVADELDNVLFYLAEILYRVLPPFVEALGEAVERHYGGDCGERWCDVLRFGSWVGGDMDGNPNVSATTIEHTLRSQRRTVIGLYLGEVGKLARYLSQTTATEELGDELRRRLERARAELPEATAAIPERHREMPYRVFLALVARRLEATRDGEAGGYAAPGDFIADLEAVAASLLDNRGRHAGWFGVHRLRLRARTFGFHLATLDARQDALLHREVMAGLLDDPSWVERPAAERTGHLEQWLEQLRSGDERPDPATMGDEAAATIEVFATLARSRAHYGPDATGLFIISMTQAADDVLTTLALARVAGWEEDGEVPLDIAPLLETVADLEAGPAILEALLASDAYRRHLARRGDRQVIMIGYSDSNKDSGIAAARWGLQQAQHRLARLGREHGIEVVFFHGRGGTVSRGGGGLVSGIAGAPAGTVNGYLRVTEQGEVINQKYGMRPLALRNLELMTGAVLQHHLADVGQHADAGMRSLMAELAASAQAHYRQLVYQSPEFIEFFRSATPIDVIERLQIGSRPASRRSGRGVEDLRAIPWVFSWAQTRINLPGVYGVGTALERFGAAAGIEPLRDLYRRWRFFRGLVDDVEMVLAKSDLGIGRRYAELAGSELVPVFNDIAAEFERTREQVLAIKEIGHLLEGQRTLGRSIRLRNPYVDPMHIIQIDLLQRWRAGDRADDDLLEALKATVNGIAFGIQNTG